MNKTWEIRKKPNFGPHFGLFDPNLIPKKNFCEFYLYYMLYIVASYHCMQFHKKTNQPNLRKWHKT